MTYASTAQVKKIPPPNKRKKGGKGYERFMKKTLPEKTYQSQFYGGNHYEKEKLNYRFTRPYRLSLTLTFRVQGKG